MTDRDSNEQYLSHLINSLLANHRYLWSKWKIIFLLTLLSAAIGIVYAWTEKPSYTAEITFAPENDNASQLGAYAGIAAQFGIDMGGAGGGAFEGDNISEFLKSRMLIEKTLFTPVQLENQKKILINYYISSEKIDRGWEKKEELRNFRFEDEYRYGVRSRDSVLKEIIRRVSRSLIIEKVDKKLNILSAKMKDEDEFFAKTFIERLVQNGIQYYADYKSKKSKQNVSILQRQTDSVKSLLTGGIFSVATTTDLNVNPIRQIGRANVQRKQVDVQVNSQLYTELLKQLELSKIALRRETPFIQIIDTPHYPLEKKKLGRLLTGILFAIVGGLLTIIFLSTRFILNQYWEKVKMLS